MMKSLIKSSAWLLCLNLLVTMDAVGQASVRKMSTIINHPSLNIYAPYISADANAIVFISDNAEDNALTPFFSFRDQADWSEPRVLPRTVYTRLNFVRGYGLSADGSTLFFSTMKTPGVGGFDIWMSNWKGDWTTPVNLGAPINSKQHEACASLSADGKTLYFMRCEKMDQNKAEQCKILRVDKLPNGTWGQPAELPDYINTGNSQTPRIMADGQTLIFSSDRMGGKGGMDLFMVRWKDGRWTEPVPLDFVNTPKDDQYVSVAGLGRYLLRDSPGPRKNELVEYLIPQALRPHGVMKIDGKVTGADGKPAPSYLSLTNIATGERVYHGRPNSDGTFLIYALEGSRYELSIDPEHGNVTYYARTLDLTNEPIPQVERVRVVLKSPEPGDEIALGGVFFDANTGELDLKSSERELQRLSRLVAGNPSLKFEIDVTLEGFRKDTLQTDPDMTEISMDTVYWKYIDIDTLGQLYEKDTASVKVFYHNDRTARQAQAIVDYLVSKGAKHENIVGMPSAVPALSPGEKKLLIKARVVSM